MRRSITEEQMSEVIKSKMYMNQVMIAYQQLKAENQLLQQQLSAVEKGGIVNEEGCVLCSATMIELTTLQTENRILKGKLAKEASEKDDWKKRHDAVLHLLRDSHAELSSAKDELQVFQKQGSAPTSADSPRSFLSDVLKRTKASSGGSSGTTSTISYSFGENSDDCASPQDQYIAAFLHPQKEDSSKLHRNDKHSVASNVDTDASSTPAWGSCAPEPRRRGAPMRFPLGEPKRADSLGDSFSKSFEQTKLNMSQPAFVSEPSISIDHEDETMASPEPHARMPVPSLGSDSVSSSRDFKYSNSRFPQQQAHPPPQQPKPVMWQLNKSGKQNAPSTNQPPHASNANMPQGARAPFNSNKLYSTPVEPSSSHPRHANKPSKQLFTHQPQHPSFHAPNDVIDAMEDDLPYHCVQSATPNWKSVHVGHVHPPQVLRVHVSPDDPEHIMDAEVYEGEVAASEPDDTELYPAARTNMYRASMPTLPPQLHHHPSMGNNVSYHASHASQPVPSPGRSSIHSAQSSEELNTQTLDLVGSLLQSLRDTLGEGDQGSHHISAQSSARSASSVPGRQGPGLKHVQASHAQAKAQAHRQQEIAAAVEERMRGGAYWGSKGAGGGEPGLQQHAGPHSARDKIWHNAAVRTAAAARAYDNGQGVFVYKPGQGSGGAPPPELQRRARGDLPSFL